MSSAVTGFGGLTFGPRTAHVFSTGQVAAVCRVASRTVSKWIDSNRLKGYRLPVCRPGGRAGPADGQAGDGQDRRVLRAKLVPFMREHGIPLDLLGELDSVVALVGVPTAAAVVAALPAGWGSRVAASGYEAGVAHGLDGPPTAYVVGPDLGREAARLLARTVAAAGTPTVLLISDDESDAEAEAAAGPRVRVRHADISPAALAALATDPTPSGDRP